MIVVYKMKRIFFSGIFIGVGACYLKDFVIQVGNLPPTTLIDNLIIGSICVATFFYLSDK